MSLKTENSRRVSVAKSRPVCVGLRGQFYSIWSAYLVKFLFVDGFICFRKLKIMSNRVRSVWALTRFVER